MAFACEHAPRRTWRMAEIALVAVAFLINPVFGALVLLWRLWEHAGRPRDLDGMIAHVKGWFDGAARHFRSEPPAANSAFEDYKRETLERLERERQKLRDQEREFAEFMAELRLTRDKEEFDRFMARRGGQA